MSFHEPTQEDLDSFMEYLELELQREEKQKQKAEELHATLKDVNDLTSFLEEHPWDSYNPPEVYYTLVEAAMLHGNEISKDYSSEVLEEICSFASDLYHYKGYLLTIMHGQGSVPFIVPWSEYKHLLGAEQLSFNF